MKGLRLYFITGGVILLIYIIAQFNRPKAIDWSESINDKEKKPFGTYILYNRLNDIFPHSKITPYKQAVYNAIAEDSVKQSTYIVICPGAEFAKPDYEVLTKYLKEGNDVFIAANSFGKAFEKNLKISTGYDLTIGDKVRPVKLFSPSVAAKKEFKIDKGVTNVYFSRFDTVKAVVLGENSDHKANFVKFAIGKGNLYLCATPKLFTNYSLLTPDGAAYAGTALSYLKNTPKIIWDEYYSSEDGGETSLMRVFLDNSTLEWAYYITIFSLLIFVLFEIKRRQRIIPVIEPLSNSTIDFVSVVGQVYYEKRNNVNIAHKKILYLFEHLRDAYQLKTNKLDAEFIEKFSAKCGITKQFTTDLVNYVKYMDVQASVSDRELIELNRIIEEFYSQSR